MSLTIATWNINSVRLRLPNLERFVRDILLLNPDNTLAAPKTPA